MTVQKLTYRHDAREWSHWTRLTYGTMPSFLDFERRFDLTCPDGFYRIRNCKIHGNSDYTCSQLFGEVQKAVEGDFDLDDDNSPINVARDILYTLGIEWI